MNNHSLYSSLLTETPAEAELLDAWLDERAAEKDVSRIELPQEVAAARQDNRRLAKAAGEYDGTLAPGQIRILSKRYTLEPEVVPRIAVLEQLESDRWLIAPFSPYATPATPGEMATGIGFRGLEVVQAWNSRVVNGVLLRKSYLFGQMDEDVREWARTLSRSASAGTEPPADFAAARGPAIRMDADPRNGYLAEATARLEPLVTAVKAMERLGRIQESVPAWSPDVFGPSAALAAGSKSARTEKLAVGESELWLSYDPENEEVWMSFYDGEGEPDTTFDGYGVLARGIEFAGVFQNATLCLPAEDVCERFTLIDRAGNPVDCRRMD